MQHKNVQECSGLVPKDMWEQGFPYSRVACNIKLREFLLNVELSDRCTYILLGVWHCFTSSFAHFNAGKEDLTHTALTNNDTKILSGLLKDIASSQLWEGKVETGG